MLGTGVMGDSPYERALQRAPKPEALVAREATAAVGYEKRLDRDPRWALEEGSRHFEERSGVHEALRRITQRLEALGVPYAVAGGMALFAHGLRRFTEDVDILVTRDALKTIHQNLDGLGYRPPFAGSKNLRDAELGVRVEFLVAGQFPGDGKPKPIAFPDPAAVAVERDGVKYLKLPALIELKLASGMTSGERIKDLADVQELIKLLDLPLDFGAGLHPYVQGKFEEIWRSVRESGKRLVLILDSVDDPALLEAMTADGVTVEPRAGRLLLVTRDPKIAAKYEMHDEADLLDLG
jgi:hypothetical protein